jgi:hypothetical protein
MKVKPSEGNSVFCVAPWTHTYLSPQSERRMCCASREKASWATQYLDAESADKHSRYGPSTLEVHWNSPYMMDIRKRLMAGEEIPQCMVCNDKILNISVYRDYFNKTLFPHKVEECFELTDENGFTTMKPISYDYRISNICNFKCRMCGDQLSSAWEAERRSLGEYTGHGDQWALPENKEIIEKFQKEVAEAELWEAVKGKWIEEIYWVGGEPLIWDIHWDIMKYLVDHRQAKDVWIRYNTNLTRINHKGNDLYDLFPHFKQVQICASIDGVGDIVEYIRHGVKWESWLDNFKKGTFLNKIYGEYAMAFDLTITSPGLFSLKELFDLSLDLNVHTLIKTTFSFDSSIVMSPLMIPRRILDPIIDDIYIHIKPKVLANPKYSYWLTCLDDLKSKKTFEEQYPDHLEGLKRGKERLQKIDAYRGNSGKIEEIFSRNKDLLAWWKSI